jgi:twitching motility protein PilU
LCIATLHAANANQALDRILHFFSETMRAELLLDLSLNLKAVISLRLVRDVDDKLLPAVEVLLATPHVVDLIQKGEIHKLKEAMKLGKDQGMQTFDEALYRLFVSGRVAYGAAIAAADSRTDLALRLRLEGLAPDGDRSSPALDQFIDKSPTLPDI